MPLCNEVEETTSASHRPVFWLPAYLLLERVNGGFFSDTSSEEGQPAPTPSTIQKAMLLLAEVPFRLWGEPDINPFYGELHLSWVFGAKQVVLISYPERTPLIHHYKRTPNAPSEHGIEEASAALLAHWLRWLQV
jgi:hypothetical protein